MQQRCPGGFGKVSIAWQRIYPPELKSYTSFCFELNKSCCLAGNSSLRNCHHQKYLLQSPQVLTTGKHIASSVNLSLSPASNVSQAGFCSHRMTQMTQLRALCVEGREGWEGWPNGMLWDCPNFWSFLDISTYFIIWLWINTCRYSLLGDEHPFATYFDVHQGYMVLTHSHISTRFTIQFIATQMICASGHLTSAVAARCSATVAGVSGGCWFHCVYDWRMDDRNRSWTRHKAAWRSTAMLLIMIHYSSDFYAPGLATRKQHPRRSMFMSEIREILRPCVGWTQEGMEPAQSARANARCFVCLDPSRIQI